MYLGLSVEQLQLQIDCTLNPLARDGFFHHVDFRLALALSSVAVISIAI
jgi:hypothetical protein